MINASSKEQLYFGFMRAVDYVNSLEDPSLVVPKIDASLYADVAKATDDTLIPDVFTPSPEPRMNQVIVASPEELRFATGYFAHLVGGSYEPQVITKLVHHEVKHALAMYHFGVSAIRYSLEVVPYEDEYALQPSIYGGKLSRQLTKLEVAATLAAPDTMSEGDNAILHAMGYTGLADVGTRIVKKNLAEGKIAIPVPQGYKRFLGADLRR